MRRETHSTARVLLLTIALAMAVPAGGCGYRAGANGEEATAISGGYHWQSLYREDLHTIAVPIFTTASFDRDVEFGLTAAIVKEIEATTPYKVVPRERADTILEGEIVSSTVGTLSSDRKSSVPQEQHIVLTVNLTWKDLRSGKILMQRRNFEQTATFYPTVGEGRFIGRQQAVERLAAAIVQELQADW